jgi:hypothetical protein
MVSVAASWKFSAMFDEVDYDSNQVLPEEKLLQIIWDA